MKNNLLGLTLGDVLLLLGVRARTGELIIESGNNIGTILVHDGKILQVFSPYSRAIGDLMVEDGLLTDSELIETLKTQKRNMHSPLGGILVKMGRVTYEVIETMVHEQIRQSVKEFQSWNNASFSFIEKESTPYDHIHLMIHEFVPADTLQSAKTFLSLETSSPGRSSPAAEPSTSS